ncbi:MAG TPA: hypothetical protein VLZ82_09220 [Microbacterium sp.]|nr:hypothetical protein [Microbacterium sp.]
MSNVREFVLDALDAEQRGQLRTISRAILGRLAPEQRMRASRMR